MRRVVWFQFIFIGLLSFSSSHVFAQRQGKYLLEYLKLNLKTCHEDTNKVKILNELGCVLWYINPDQGIQYSQQALVLAKKLRWTKGIADAFLNLGMNIDIKHNQNENTTALRNFQYAQLISEKAGYKTGLAKSLYLQAGYFCKANDYARAIELGLKARDIYTEINEKREIAWAYYILGYTYLTIGYDKTGFEWLKLAESAAIKYKHIQALPWIYNQLGIYYFNKEADSSAYYLNQAIEIFNVFGFVLAESTPLGDRGRLYLKKGEFERAKIILVSAIHHEELNHIQVNISANLSSLGDVYYGQAMSKDNTDFDIRHKSGKGILLDSAKYFYQSSLAQSLKETMQNAVIQGSYLGLYKVYLELGDFQNANIFLVKTTALKDTLFSLEKQRALANLEAKQTLKLSEKQIEILKGRSFFFKVVIGSTIVGLLLLLISILVVFRSLSNSKKANALLQERNEVIDYNLKKGAAYVNSLIPARIDHPNIETDYLYIPSDKLGGDSFGYHWIDEENFAIYMIDVCEHGIGAALHSVSVLHFLNSSHHPTLDPLKPELVMGALNHNFQSEAYNGMFFTMWYGIMNLSTHVLTYCCAGHPAPVLFRGNGDMVTLGAPGLSLGCQPSYQYCSESVTLPEKAVLLIFSDGVYEIAKPDGSVMQLVEFYNMLMETPISIVSPELIHQQMARIQNSLKFQDDFSILKVLIKPFSI